jgi:hypothetical protein
MLGYSYEQFVEKAIWEIGSLQDIVANKEKFSELKKRNLSVMLIYHFKQLMEKRLKYL